MIARPDIAYHQARILIVDDEPQNRALLEVMLTPEGFVLLTAASGAEALAIVTEQPPDLILLDVMMPGMDGAQVAAAIKRNPATRNIPVIMVTAQDDRDARMRGLAAGAEDFLAKPVDRAELCLRVRNLLRLRAYGDYHDRYSRMLEGEVASRTADLVERTEQSAVLAEQAALLDLAQDAIVVRDMRSRILLWNRGAEALYGWPSKEALGRNVTELLRIEFSEPTATIQAALLREGKWEGESTHHRRDGTRLIVASRWALQRDADGTPVRILTINNDITDRKRADSELRLLTERLSLATAVAKVGVWEWDLASHTLTWDATMFAIYGLPPVVPMPVEHWSSAVHREDRSSVEVGLRRLIDARGHGSAEYRIVLPDGTERQIASVQRVVLDERGNVTRMIGVNVDVTDRKEAERALEQVREDRMRFKDEFLSHVSHELRSPLTAIKQFTTILLGGLAGELNEEQQQYQEIVLKNVRQLQSMIDDLLEVTRLETGKLTMNPDRVSVEDAVTDSLDTLQGAARARGVALSCDLPPDLPFACADATRLRQILIILLDNAIKFTPDGGEVTLRARVSPQDPRSLLIEVADTGCGISPEMIGRIFERLYQSDGPAQSSRKGLGLGLYICKELVTRQGGTIWVEQDVRKGATFSFTLPKYSLGNLIAPLFRNDEWPSDSVSLVMVQVCLKEAWPSLESQEAWSREVRDLIHGCLLPGLDVLLPQVSSGTRGGRFFVAAFANEQVASVVAERIQRHFERLPHMKQELLSLSVSHSMVPSIPRDVGASMEQVVARMATSLEDAITSHVVTEGVLS